MVGKACRRRYHEESNRAGFGHVYPLSELQAKVVGPLAFARHCRPFFIKLSGSASVRSILSLLVHSALTMLAFPSYSMLFQQSLARHRSTLALFTLF
jgi:hypothetical protein